MYSRKWSKQGHISRVCCKCYLISQTTGFNFFLQNTRLGHLYIDSSLRRGLFFSLSFAFHSLSLVCLEYQRNKRATSKRLEIEVRSTFSSVEVGAFRCFVPKSLGTTNPTYFSSSAPSLCIRITWVSPLGLTRIPGFEARTRRSQEDSPCAEKRQRESRNC